MTKEEILNGMSEQEFYDMYPTQEDWADAQQMKLGGLSGAPHNGQPTADEFFSYGSHYNDSVNVPMGNPYYAAEGGTPYYGGPTRPYAYGGGLPSGANEYDMPCMNCGGYMEEGGDYNSPTNYGSFNIPMAYGGGLPKAQRGNNPNYEYTPLSKRDSTNVMRQLEKPEFQPGYSYRVSKNRNNVYQTSPSGQENEYNGWQSNTAKHAALQEFIARQDLAAGKVPSQPPVFADTYNKYLGTIKKEDGGILDASNNMSYPTFEDGGKYNLLNLIKAASKKMKKAYGGDTVTQGGNSDNYPQGITQAFKNGIKNNTMNALMNEEQESFSNEIKQMGGYSGGYSGGYNNGYNSGNMYNNYNQQPQFDRKNQAMQSMYQQRIDDTQANLKNDSKYFGQSMNYLAATANPYTKTTVKAQTGTQTGSRNMSAEEWAWMDEQRKAKEDQAAYNKENEANYARYFGSQGTRGMNYIPMNYNQLNKISKKDVGIMKQLANNPSTNLKEFSHRHFGPWSKTKMTFDYNKPYDNSKITLNDGPAGTSSAVGNLNTGRSRTPGGMYPAGQNLLDMLPNAANFDKANSSLPQPMNQEVPPNLSGDWNSMLNNKQLLPPNTGSKAYGGVAKYQTAGQTPISFPESLRFVPGMAQEGEGDDVVVPGAPKPDGFNPDQVIENKPFVPGYQNKSTATITQKGRPGFSGEGMANAMIAGTNLASSFLEAGQNAKNEQKLGELRLADNAFVSTPGNAQSRGDYDPNSGMFRPDDKVPVQFAGYSAYGGSFQEGGMQQQQQPDPQQVMQGVATMLQQGAQPEQVAKQLVEMGIPQEQVIQIIQAVMQQLQGGQEPQQQPMRYGGFATGGAAEEESYEEDLNEDEIAELRAQGYDVEYI